MGSTAAGEKCTPVLSSEQSVPVKFHSSRGRRSGLSVRRIRGEPSPSHKYRAAIAEAETNGCRRAAAESFGISQLGYIANIVLIVPALIGARPLFVASEWKYHCRNPRHIWDRIQGGFMM